MRQLLPSYAPFSGAKTSAPLKKGGHGGTTRDEAIENLGAIPVELLGVPNGPAQADGNGLVPVNFLGMDHTKVGYSIEGPEAIPAGGSATYRITNYDSRRPASIIAANSAGETSSVILSVDDPDTFTVQDGSTRGFIDLSVNTRIVRIPVIAPGILKPRILEATSDQSRTVTFYTMPFDSEPKTRSAWGSSTGFSLGTATHVEIAGSQNAVLTLTPSNRTYAVGATDTSRIIPVESDTAALNSSGNITDYRLIESLAVHTSTDWQIATDSEFTDIIRESLGDTVNLTSWTTVVPNGQYFVRCRFHGTGD